MAKYAVVRIKGHQYKISEGEEVLVDKFEGKEPEIETLLFVDGEKITVGKPVLTDVKIKVKVVKEMELGEKLRVIKYKSKSRYRRVRGFRPQHERILVEKISIK
jgi:large subunit ribosomal protein L21